MPFATASSASHHFFERYFIAQPTSSWLLRTIVGPLTHLIFLNFDVSCSNGTSTKSKACRKSKSPSTSCLRGCIRPPNYVARSSQFPDPHTEEHSFDRLCIHSQRQWERRLKQWMNAWGVKKEQRGHQVPLPDELNALPLWYAYGQELILFHACTPQHCRRSESPSRIVVSGTHLSFPVVRLQTITLDLGSISTRPLCPGHTIVQIAVPPVLLVQIQCQSDATCTGLPVLTISL